MASEATGREFPGNADALGAALQHSPWRSRARLSSGLDRIEKFLCGAGFDRAPWLAVSFAGGIAAWFALDNRWQWLAFLTFCICVVSLVLSLLRKDGSYPYLRQAGWLVPLAAAAGCVTVWSKSELVGAPGLARPLVTTLSGVVLDREEQPAEQRIRLVVATREPDTARIIRVRINVPREQDAAAAAAGATIRVKARLMPPAPPMLPGGYDFARAAWFQGLAATGSALSPVEVVAAGKASGWLDGVQTSLSRHVRERLPSPSGGIAAALASGDRGAIAEPDAQAMRDAGLAHLLSISGLHVSAVVAAAYILALRLLALSPWLALRVRLPVVSAGGGALAGIGYTLLTGAEVPTVRSCIGAVLVLAAMALGREPLSLRMLAVAALFVMVLWPESVIGPSFQMSFSAVIAIVALHSSAIGRRFMTPRDEGWAVRGLRYLGATLVTGMVIELALMPIGLFHFHRSGIYGSFANLVAIPLTTVVSMPLIALALVLDTVGAGWPAWWLAGKSIDFLLWLAHAIAAQPGAVTRWPAMGHGAVMLFVAGGLWLALWRGRVRLWGLLPAAIGAGLVMMLKPPDLLVSGDGRHVGIAGDGGELLVLRESRSDYVRDNISELAGMSGEQRALADWPGTRCSRDFCSLELVRGGRNWRLLIGRSHDRVPERELAAACDRADIVIADRRLPRSCQPTWLKADRNLLDRTGGLAIDLANRKAISVSDGQGQHGWWRPPAATEPRPRLKGTPGPQARQTPSQASPGLSPVVGNGVRQAANGLPKDQ